MIFVTSIFIIITDRTNVHFLYSSYTHSMKVLFFCILIVELLNNCLMNSGIKGTTKPARLFLNQLPLKESQGRQEAIFRFWQLQTREGADPSSCFNACPSISAVSVQGKEKRRMRGRGGEREKKTDKLIYFNYKSFFYFIFFYECCHET